jgi:phospholipid/cholesterol/gamma-HCH transport system substrate-binding protein
MRLKNEALVGLVVVVAILTVLAGTLFLSGRKLGERRRELTATFRSTGQLTVGSPVTYRGVKVGAVKEIRLSERNDGVFVTLEVQEGIHPPADAGVLLSSTSFFGDWAAQVVSRSEWPDVEFVGTTGPNVLPGGALPDITQLTAVASNIASNMETLSERVQLAFTEETAVKIRETIENVSEVADRLGGFVDQQTRTYDQVSRNVLESTANIRSATATAELAASDVRGAITRGDVRQILDNAKRASANLEAFSAQLNTAAGGVPVLTARADTALQQFGEVASNLNTTLQGMQPGLSQVGPTLIEARNAIATLNRAMTAMEQGNGTIGRLMSDPALFEETQRAIVTLRRLLADIQQNPAKYIGEVQVFE